MSLHSFEWADRGRHAEDGVFGDYSRALAYFYRFCPEGYVVDDDCVSYCHANQADHAAGKAPIARVFS